MKRFRFDVIVIGCGPAGATAAATLARAGISVLVLEAGAYAGAENWSGCVYFTENLAHPEAFGPAAVAASPFERRVLRRGIFLHNGLDLIGLSYHNSETFKNCHTVLRPVFDPYWAAQARALGATVLEGATVTSLIRRENRVVGVETEHGPVYAEVVFLAEGDASHLVRRERLEKSSSPRFMQGVKAVFSLDAGAIEKRFGLRQKEGCANEYLIRSGQAGGQTAHLNIAAFLYTNRNSLSFGYVVPLDQLKEHYRGDHGKLLEWLRGLPPFRDLLQDAVLSAYGAKLIRSGGVRDQPVLVENGLAVGGAATGLGIDLPYPNFTGPASASGLLFGLAVRKLLKDAKAISADRLRESYLVPLQDSVYGKNASLLADWPDYLEHTRVLFGRTADLLCGSAHFLTEPRGSYWNTARLLRGHLSGRAIQELFSDTLRLLRASGLWRAFWKSLGAGLAGRWTLNLFRGTPKSDPGFAMTIASPDRGAYDPGRLPWPLSRLLRRLSPALAEGMKIVYANNNVPLSEKFESSVRTVLGRLRLTDFAILPGFAAGLILLALATALLDLIRYYILRQPVEKLLGGPVAVHGQALQKARDLDQVRIVDSFEAKLATITYRIGGSPHIHVYWPADLLHHGDMTASPLWSVCPARVYQYEAPLFGRGVVSVNYENCIKCESCWHAADEQVRWGRTSDHRLIYRPESDAIQTLLAARPAPAVPRQPKVIETPPFSAASGDPQSKEAAFSEVRAAIGKLFGAVQAYETAVQDLPASADATRRDWPNRVGVMLLRRLKKLLLLISNDAASRSLASFGLTAAAQIELKNQLDNDLRDFQRHLTAGQEFHALSTARRLRDETLGMLSDSNRDADLASESAEALEAAPPGDGIAALFPDRIAKEWEETPISDEGRENLLRLFGESEDPLALIRALSQVSPALGWLAAHHLEADRLLKGRMAPAPPFDICAVDIRSLPLASSGNGFILKGAVELIPLALARKLLLVHDAQCWIVSLDQAGLAAVPTPAIGFRSAGLHRLEFQDLALSSSAAFPLSGAPRAASAPDGPAYASVALGAADYLARRAREHAEGRIQFDQQMRDTQGRNGIAKLGAVKAMVARIEAWRHFLSLLLRRAERPEFIDGHPEWPELCAAVSAMAFAPDPGRMGYDAGQVFGGFAYSEDDLLSRAYRDSAVFRFFKPGLDASLRLAARFDEAKTIEPRLAETRSAYEEIRGGPLMETAEQWDAQHARWKQLRPGSDPMPAGEAAAMLLGLRWALLDIQDRIEAGRPSEAEAAACAVLLQLAEQAVDAMEVWRRDAPPVPVAAFPERPDRDPVALPLSYEQIVSGTPENPARPYRSGQYLMEAFDVSPRYVPEIQLHDPPLRSRWEESNAWFIENIWTRPFGGLHIERYVEKIHGIPQGTLDGYKQRGYFSTVIPSELDGGGWWKAEYYILTTAAGRYGDAGLLLVIMASTSIGTTPVLLGLEKEMPLAEEELKPLGNDPRRLGEIGEKLDRIIESLKRPDPARLKKSFSELMGLVDARIRRTRVVKYLAANFLKAFYAAGISGQRRDLEGFVRGLKDARQIFSRLAPTIQEALDELPRRRRAHEFFLRKLGHGGISAFALTEPTAGSDTGGVKTTARLKSAPLAAMEDGRYRFRTDGGAESGGPSNADRYLIDADRIQFGKQYGPSETGYRTPSGEIVPIRCDDYNYDTDEGLRYYEYQTLKRPFHDIAQIRTREGRPVYDYYELNGAKMWITNGHVATQFCLYAQSPEGVTGFMLDRHSEGLKVGADERKMGQRGSPTNEIAIDQARVPREGVIGYEGHGQVNALETLNVGRCGLATAAITIMRKLLLEALEQTPASAGRDRLLSEAATILFGSDCITFYLIGLFDRESTESVRMESAIAKFVTSEDLHEVLTLIERAYGPSGVTETYRVEKLRRDSRILNIYEGTSEVQRFLILKDLIAAAKDWKPVSAGTASGGIASLAKWKDTLRENVREAAERLGETAWMDAVLQPTYFPLAEMAAEIFRLDSLLYRMNWLRENRDRLGADYADPLLRVGERALGRCEHRLAGLQRQCRRNAALAAKGFYRPEAAAADAAFDRAARKPAENPLPRRGLDRPVRILCLLRPVADTAPVPRLRDGSLSEILWRLNPSDEAAAALALHLKRISPAKIVVHLVSEGGKEAEPLLRSALGAGADEAFRIESGASLENSAFAGAVRQLEQNGRYDLILAGAVSEDGSEPLAPFVAGALARSCLRASRLEVLADRQDCRVSFENRSEPLPREPVVISWDQNGPGLKREINSLIEAQFANIGLLDPGVEAAGRTIPIHFSHTRAAAASAETIRDLSRAAEYLKAYSAGIRARIAPPHSEPLREKSFPSAPAVWAVLEAARSGSAPGLLGGAARLAQSHGRIGYAVLLASDSSWPALAGLADSRGMAGAYVVKAPDRPLTGAGRLEWLKRFQKSVNPLQIVLGPHWADAAAGLAGAERDPPPILFTDLSELDWKEGLTLYKPAYGAKLRRSARLPRNGADRIFLTVSPTAEFQPAGRMPGFFAATPDVRLDPDPAGFEAGTAAPLEDLSTAEVIVDLGYGIRGPDGFRLALELKKALEDLGLKPHFGATRKVTQDLKLLPLDRQIGQTGVRVNPRLILALGISGAPQHMDYIGGRAAILAFNKDPEAPLMKFNESRPSPVVHPIAGNLFETIPRLIEMLKA